MKAKTCNLKSRVEQQLRSQKTLNDATVQSMADNFCMSRRSFQRKLSEQNTSFRKLIDQEWRWRIIAKLEESQFDMDNMLFELGCTEVNSFYRAAKRRTGKLFCNLRSKKTNRD